MFIFAIVIAVFGAFIFWRILYDPLADVPRVPLANIAPAWLIYTSSKSQWHLSTIRLHSTRGPVVRIAPRELSFATIEAHQDIYGNKRKGRTAGDRSFLRHVISLLLGDVSFIASAQGLKHHNLRRNASLAIGETLRLDGDALRPLYVPKTLFDQAQRNGQMLNLSGPLSDAIWAVVYTSQDTVAARMMLEGRRAQRATEGELIINFVGLLTASYETSTTNICALFHFLLQTPKAYKQLENEICANFTHTDQMSDTELAKLPFLNACINETLRLVVTLQPRFLARTSPGTVIDGIYVPKGVSGSHPSIDKYWLMINRSEYLWTEITYTGPHHTGMSLIYFFQKDGFKEIA
ncbi:uncharacterized protein N7503_008434 [Penicillium pulvis]|uniref:uncharacterized protein n=1 Tax=Penicillium pulvis TaxID=1562058 RepID=UPI002547F9C2|nr:uncharacterized protein N7503_008434 [Penicillium pulvis]KAJ5792456.1 hypothetical protein N7503_008434 [Penicillium pulvis]